MQTNTRTERNTFVLIDTPKNRRKLEEYRCELDSLLADFCWCLNNQDDPAAMTKWKRVRAHLLDYSDERRRRWETPYPEFKSHRIDDVLADFAALVDIDGRLTGLDRKMQMAAETARCARDGHRLPAWLMSLSAIGWNKHDQDFKDMCRAAAEAFMILADAGSDPLGEGFTQAKAVIEAAMGISSTPIGDLTGIVVNHKDPEWIQ
ncbi:hypothetical protein ROS1_28520 [Roseibium sp. ROS1]